MVVLFVLIRIREAPMRTSFCTSMRCLVKKRKHDTLIRVEKHTKHLSKNQLAESLGWIGACALLGSYALLSFEVIDANSLIYHGLMLTGAAGLAVITYRHRAFQSFIVNSIFSIIALIAIARLLMFA